VDSKDKLESLSYTRFPSVIGCSRFYERYWHRSHPSPPSPSR